MNFVKSSLRNRYYFIEIANQGKYLLGFNNKEGKLTNALYFRNFNRNISEKIDTFAKESNLTSDEINFIKDIVKNKRK